MWPGLVRMISSLTSSLDSLGIRLARPACPKFKAQGASFWRPPQPPHGHHVALVMAASRPLYSSPLYGSMARFFGTRSMQNKFRGVMQSPITPLKDDYSLDLPTFEKVLDFHVRTGAPAISWPHHKGESLSLTIPERKRFAEATVKVVAGRVPVTIHVSALAVEDTMELAQHAQRIGADGILAITPYFWTPTRDAIHDYFVRLSTAIDLPVLSYNSPSYLAGVEITGELMSRLIQRLPNFVGVKEASFNSEKFLEISRAALALRADYAMPTGVEFLLPSVPLGGVGS